MFKRIYFIALVPNQEMGTKKHTLYLFNKEEKIVLPIDIKSPDAVAFLTGQTHIDDKAPHIYVFLKQLMGRFNLKLISVTVFGKKNGIYYSNLNLLLNQKQLELKINFTDAFVLSRLFDTPLYIEHKVLDERGIRVTKEIIRDALRE